MELVEVTIKNFKRIANVTLPLSEVNIIVGENASGKSSIIQSIHLSTTVMRQADRVDSSKTSTVGIEELDYLPTDRYSMLGHNIEWGNRSNSSCSEARLLFKGGNFIEARCELRSARNAGISITGQVPSELTARLRTKRNFFSAYIPGISGIPNKEEKKSRKVVLKSCSYGDSNVILRNVLLLLKHDKKLGKLEEYLRKITSKKIAISVEHDYNKDLNIKCSMKIDEIEYPIELSGTGYLQLTQIFSYILLFEPGILLIDEPDIHLHPSVQEELVRVLSDVAKERGLRILLTTHSPFIVRGAPAGANVYWINDGRVETENRNNIELRLGWGVVGKEIFFISEDEDTSLLKKIISQWPDIERRIAYLPGNGFKNLPSPSQAANIKRALSGNFKIIVHRDRDAMTDEEANTLTSAYEREGINLWLTKGSDIEAYFCSAEFVREICGTEILSVQSEIEELLKRHEKTFFDQFASQRAQLNAEFHKSGGSPTNDEVFQKIRYRPLGGMKGKTLFKMLSNRLNNAGFSKKSILFTNFRISVCDDLRDFIETLLEK